MNQPTYVNNRVLKLNVGFLLTSGPGKSHDSVIDFPAVKVADDLMIKYLRGPLRLSRTKEGILVQAQLETAVDDECYRCLDEVEHTVNVNLEELYAYQSYPSQSEFSIGDDAILNLAPLLRAEVLIELSHGVLCRPDCKGLCPECGTNLNKATCNCEDNKIDPRMEALKKLLKSD
ncbi:MAG: hypothetical protein OHK0046_23160 [Anaerolineae bacterium]